MSSPAGEEPDLTGLYTDLKRFADAESFDAALKVTDKILKAAPNEKEAVIAKCVCLLQLEEFQKCLNIICNNYQQFENELVFEKAYCEYRLNLNEESLKTLNGVRDLDLRSKELKAQLLYRMENYAEALNIYRDVVKNSKDSYDDERQTNVSAVVAGLSLTTDPNTEVGEPDIDVDNYEQVYNSACYLIGRGDYQSANQRLREAELSCISCIDEDDDMTEEDKNDELSVIRVQLAYCSHQLGEVQQALNMYNAILKNRPCYADVTAVAANNVAVLNGEQNVFDSKKKMKLAAAPELSKKLTRIQSDGISINQCLLAYYSNQSDVCKSLCKMLRQNLNHSTIDLIETALLTKTKQINKAVQLLESCIEQGNSDLSVKLTLMQLYINQNQFNSAVKLINGLNDVYRYKAGMVSLLVTLLSLNQTLTEIGGAYQRALDYLEKNKQTSSETYQQLLRASAEFYIKQKLHKQAAEQSEKLRKLKPTDRSVLSMLFAAYSQFDSNMAKQVSGELPSIQSLAESLDISQLESTPITTNKYKQKKDDKLVQDGGDVEIKNKKKKKRKVKLPKNYDPTSDPDPERWLPRRERSTWRARRKDKRNKEHQIGKGSQGAAAAGGPELDITKMETAQPQEAAAPPPSTGNKGYQATKQQKKKKRRR